MVHLVGDIRVYALFLIIDLKYITAIKLHVSLCETSLKVKCVMCWAIGSSVSEYLANYN